MSIFPYIENIWIAIFAENVVHSKVVGRITRNKSCFSRNVILQKCTGATREREVVGRGGRVWRGSCVPPKSLKVWRRKTRVMSLIKTQLVLPHRDARKRLGLIINTQLFRFKLRMMILIRFSFPRISPNFCLWWYQNFSSFFSSKSWSYHIL